MLRSVSWLNYSRALPRLLTKPTSNTPISRALRTSIPKQKTYKRFSDPQPGRAHHGPEPGGPMRRNSPLNYKQWDTRTKSLAAVVTAGGIYYTMHLEQVPETGRIRFMNMSSEAEAKTGRETANLLKAELGHKILPPNHPTSLRVRAIVSRLLKQSNLGHVKGDTPSAPLNLDDELWTPSDDYGTAAKHTYGSNAEWDVVVVNDEKIINAMATPGMILVFTGIIPVCQTEDGLATVLSHEIGHVVARHVAEHMSSETISIIALVLLQALLGIDFGISNTLRRLLLELPNSRQQELEADIIGMKIMSRACYEPSAAPQIYERLGKASPESGLNFLSTHPTSQDRIEQLEKALPEAYAIVAANPECSYLKEQYQQFRNNANRGVVTRIEFL